MMKRIFVFLFVIILMIQIFPLSAFAGDAQTGILAELEGATVGGQAFDMNDYPKKDGADAELLSFMERNYRYDGNQSDYQMIVYIYNPSETSIVSGGKNTITMAVKFDENGVAEDYEKFNMKFVEKTENNRFYKFAVVDHVSAHDGNKIVQRVDRAARRYTVSELEVQYIGTFNGTASPVGKSFVFTGYQSEKNLSVSTGLVETIELDVNFTYWRSVSSSLGTGHQNQLNSVYFSVPEDLFDKYGKIQAVKAEWNEQKTLPVFFTSNQTVYEAVYPWLGVDIGEYNKDVPFSLYAGQTNNAGYVGYDWTYNVYLYQSATQAFDSDYVCEKLPYCFLADVDGLGAVAVDGEDLKTYIQSQSYADWLFAAEVDNGRTKGKQEVMIYSDDLYNLESYGSNHNWWQVFWNFTLKGANKDEVYQDFMNIAPFYEVQASDVALNLTNEEISDTLFIKEGDADKIRDAYNKAKAEDKRLMLFRFAATDYYSDYVRYRVNGEVLDEDSSKIAEETVFLDFSVISLTFYQDGVSTVIPVVSDSQDAIGDLTNPPVADGLFSDDKMDWSWVKRLVMMIAALALIVICWKPALMIFDAVMGIFHNTATDIEKLMKDRGNKK